MIKILCVGKIKDRHLQELIADYQERIGHYHRIEICEVRDEKITADEKMVLSLEGDRLLEKIGKDEFVILLDLHGRSVDSMAFAEMIDRSFVHHAKLTFVIGGSLGLDDRLRERADEKISLSKLTFLHSMTRLILLEQIYRSFKILNHETYHK